MSSLKAFELTATTIARDVTSGKLSIADVADFYITRTEAFAESLNSHLFFDADDVRRQAQFQTKRLQAGESLSLAGVPVLIKDNISTKGVPTTCGSRILENFRPPYDAHVIERLRHAGALIFGKTNCDEFAMGSSNENSAFGAVKNPWDPSRVPGGSSGGSAAAVAADLAPISLGSDTGGSIRQPAALCGVVGLKPTYGLVSRYGLVAYGSSLDQIGPLARTVEDTALVMDVLAGHDDRDSTSVRSPTLPGYVQSLRRGASAQGLKIGVVKEFFGDGLDGATRAALEVAIAQFKKLGAIIEDVSIPSLKYSIAAYYIVATAEASSNLARYDGVRYGLRVQDGASSLKQVYRRTRSQGFGREVKQRIMLGTFVLSSGYYDAYYAKANRARQLLANDTARAFQKVDLLLSPTSPTTAFKLGEKVSDPMSMYLADICTIAANLAGIPGISIPCGFDAAGLPIGLQLMAPKFEEEKLLKGAYAYEQATQWHRQRQPKL